MTEAERIARAVRAEAALAEFFDPMLSEMDAEYSARIIEVANTELFFWRRTAKLTRLSDALRMVRTLRAGMSAIVRDGEMAADSVARSDKIDSMTKPQRRLVSIAPR